MDSTEVIEIEDVRYFVDKYSRTSNIKYLKVLKLLVETLITREENKNGNKQI